MALGTSLFLLAAGAILRFAVYYSVHGIAIGVVGIVLMIVGALGLVLSIALGITPWGTRRTSYASYRAPGSMTASDSVRPANGTTVTYEEREYVDERGPVS